MKTTKKRRIFFVVSLLFFFRSLFLSKPPCTHQFTGRRLRERETDANHSHNASEHSRCTFYEKARCVHWRFPMGNQYSPASRWHTYGAKQRQQETYKLEQTYSHTHAWRIHACTLLLLGIGAHIRLLPTQRTELDAGPTWNRQHRSHTHTHACKTTFRRAKMMMTKWCV